MCRPSGLSGGEATVQREKRTKSGYDNGTRKKVQKNEEGWVGWHQLTIIGKGDCERLYRLKVLAGRQHAGKT